MPYTARIRVDLDERLKKAAALQGVAKQTLLSQLIMQCESLDFDYDEPRIDTCFQVEEATVAKIKKLADKIGVPQTRLVDYLIHQEYKEATDGKSRSKD